MAGKFNFKEVAMANTLLSPIMVGRTKMTTSEVVNRELTITGFDFAPKFDQNGVPMTLPSGEVDTFGVVIFQEEPDKYYCVGTVFSQVCHAWAAGFSSPAEASEALSAEGGVKVRFIEKKTKRNQNLTAVEIL